MDRENLDLWVPFKKGDCESCFALCCTLPLEVSIVDLIRLELVSEEEAAFFSPVELFKKLQKEKKPVSKYDKKTGVFILSQKNGFDCFYLDSNRRCTVYEKRPRVCRSFPKIGPKPGFCPKKNKMI